MASGFFKSNKKALATPVRLTGCASCGLASGCLHPKMEPTGEGNRKFLIIAEAPGQTEDETGIQLVGKVGGRVRQTLRGMGVDLDQDCRKTNSVRCRPPNNITPTNDQVAQCRHHVFEEIKRFQPKVILAMGGPSLYSLIGHRWKHDTDFSISRWQGLAIPDHELGAWLVTAFHPGYVERAEKGNPAVSIIWKKDLQRAVDLLDTPLPPKPDPEIRIIHGEAIGKYLTELWARARSTGWDLPFRNMKPGTSEWMAYWKLHPEHQDNMLRFQKGEIPKPAQDRFAIFWDYESDGLKPYRADYRIHSCSIAENPHLAHAWLWEDMDKKNLALFQSVMESLPIRKGGANIKFEHNVTRVRLGFEIKGWWWDVVNAAHILDNRRGNSNVKFQAFTRLGIMDYDSHIRPYLYAIGPDGKNDPNGKNRIFELPPKDVAKYCGEDSCFEYGICLHQRKEMGYV